MQDWKGSGTLLIVEDNLGVREVTRGMLERFGFTVLTAEDGEQGVELFSQNADQITLALVDLVMPKLDGRETLMQIRSVKPEARVILMSGHSEQEAHELFADIKPTGFVQKPFSMTALLQKVRQVLEAETGNQAQSEK